MRFEKRIESLEENILIKDIDQKLDAELSAWFKSNPDYQCFVQPEYNNGVVMPEHLCEVLSWRVKKALRKNNLVQGAVSNLSKDDLFALTK